MSVAHFVISILGCADGGTACTPVATLPVHYSSERQCDAATTEALQNNSDFDFPTLVAHCREGAVSANGDVPTVRERTLAGR